jgi:hypothetical protein
MTRPVIFAVVTEAMLLVGSTSNNTIARNKTSAIARVVVPILAKFFDDECEAASCLVFVVLPSHMIQLRISSCYLYIKLNFYIFHIIS